MSYLFQKIWYTSPGTGVRNLLLVKTHFWLSKHFRGPLSITACHNESNFIVVRVMFTPHKLQFVREICASNLNLHGKIQYYTFVIPFKLIKYQIQILSKNLDQDAVTWPRILSIISIYSGKMCFTSATLFLFLSPALTPQPRLPVFHRKRLQWTNWRLKVEMSWLFRLIRL